MVRLETGPSRTPDFEVKASGSRLVAEIKEFTPNPHDEEQARAKARGGAVVTSLDGRRVRRAIEDAGPQLKKFRDEHIPTVVFLFDKLSLMAFARTLGVPISPPKQIEWGMYGQHAVDYEVPVLCSPIYLGDRRGGNRELTNEQRTYVSAVAVLAEGGDSAWYYHNYFATVQLSRAVLNDERDRHFHNPSHPLETASAGWAELLF